MIIFLIWIYKIYFLGKFRRFSVVMYVSMGWCIVLTLKQVMIAVPYDLLRVIFIGGLFYTSGIIFYQMKSIPFNHAIWHVFVLLGSIVHFLGMILLI